MNTILSLAPQNVWKHFYALTQVPHPSGHLAPIQTLLLDFAKSIGVEAFQDEAGNIIYRKPATPGMENRKTTVLQAHMDMVPQKNNDTAHDFQNDPIQTYIDGDWVKAKGTTLGADNGIGLAAIMAVMEDKTLKHGPLEALITADEETGMYGAFGLKPGTITGEILLNLDSEDEGELYIGCAGGEDLTATLSYKEVETEADDVALKVTVKGLRGGHSGLEINQGRANANKLMARFLNQVITFDEAYLSTWKGGNMRNAIPRECEAIITLPAEGVEEVLAYVKECETLWNEEYCVHETPIKFYAETVELPKFRVPEEITDNLVNAIYACQDGVLRMIPTIPDTVETSSNLSIVIIEGGKAEVRILSRSSRDSMKDYLNTALESCFSMAGMEVVRSGSYSGWEPNVNSPILKAMKESYQTQFGKEPEVKVIHAGLECGILGAVEPGMDMISFGPTMRSPHSPDERCLIPSVAKFYDFLIATLANIPVKG
ncbi:MAG: aminoacyl-histidine dipeptidase [Phocaeicola sp.]